MADWEEELKKVSQCPQRQDSAMDQLIDLHAVANKLGFYDAADILEKLFKIKSFKE